MSFPSSLPSFSFPFTTQLNDRWLAPLTLQADHLGDVPCASGERASDKGLLSMTLDEFLELLDWSGRQLRTNKRGAIPNHLAPVLQRLGIEGEELLDTLEDFPDCSAASLAAPNRSSSARRKSADSGYTACDLQHESSVSKQIASAA